MAIANFRQQFSDALAPWLARRGMPVPRGLLLGVYRWYKFIDLIPLRRLIRTRVEPGTVAIDVGAHLGFASRLLGIGVGSQGRVLALEPQAEMGPWITASGDNIRYLNAAAHDHDGVGSLSRGGSFGTDSHVSSGPGTTRLMALDSLLGDLNNRPVSFLKIDAQGGEYEVLAGAETMLRMHKPDIFLELGGRGLERAGHTVEEVIRFLVNANYTPHRVSLFGVRPIGIETVVQNVRRRGFADYLFVHKSRVRRRGS